MSFELDLERVRTNTRAAQTEELLDRVTFYRAGMEPAALAVIEEELRQRGVTPREIEDWGPKPGEDYLWLPDGTVAQCSYCRRPAVRYGWGWLRLWGKLPIFPRLFRCCEDHDGQ